MITDDVWRRCSSCRNDIGFGAQYWICNVSTCNRARMALYFCSVPCWEAHLPTMRHREAYAVEKRAPSRDQYEREQAESEAAESVAMQADESHKRHVVATAAAVARDDDDLPRDVLIVVSKLKKYVKARSGMNTSDRVLDALSDIVRRACDDAIRRAAEDGRKTLLDRDFVK